MRESIFWSAELSSFFSAKDTRQILPVRRLTFSAMRLAAVVYLSPKRMEEEGGMKAERLGAAMARVPKRGLPEYTNTKTAFSMSNKEIVIPFSLLEDIFSILLAIGVSF